MHTFICGGVHISEINKSFVGRESLGQIDIKNRGIIYWTKLANQSSQLDWCSSGWVRALNTFGTLLKLSCLQVIVCLHWFCCSDHLWLCDVKTKSENNLTSCSKIDPHGPFKSCDGISENPLNQNPLNGVMEYLKTLNQNPFNDVTENLSSSAAAVLPPRQDVVTMDTCAASINFQLQILCSDKMFCDSNLVLCIADLWRWGGANVKGAPAGRLQCSQSHSTARKRRRWKQEHQKQEHKKQQRQPDSGEVDWCLISRCQ